MTRYANDSHIASVQAQLDRMVLRVEQYMGYDIMRLGNQYWAEHAETDAVLLDKHNARFQDTRDVKDAIRKAKGEL